MVPHRRLPNGLAAADRRGGAPRHAALRRKAQSARDGAQLAPRAGPRLPQARRLLWLQAQPRRRRVRRGDGPRLLARRRRHRVRRAPHGRDGGGAREEAARPPLRARPRAL
eukprot:2221495-Prymnesium_polylepis.1